MHPSDPMVVQSPLTSLDRVGSPPQIKIVYDTIDKVTIGKKKTKKSTKSRDQEKVAKKFQGLLSN